MLQGRASYLSPPVYGHSHFKKFWLKKMETEELKGASPPLYAVNCTALEMKGTSPPPAAIRAAAAAPAVAPEEKKITYAVEKSELDYTLALGVGLPDQEEEDSHSYDGFSSGEEKNEKFAAMAEEEAQPSNLRYGNGESQLAAAKMCADCRTVKTPLWRNGPQGPKTLCNACGIRYKKMGKRPPSNGERPCSPSTPPISPSCKQHKIHGKRKREMCFDFVDHHDHDHAHQQQRKKMKKSLGSSSLLLESHSSRVERIRKGLLRYRLMRNSIAKDEEEGAMLLMALSWGVASC